MGRCQTPPDLLTPSPPWLPAVDWQKDDGSQDSSDYLASIKEDLFDEEVFVFTSNGDVVGLHKVSRTANFAYQIHSEIGPIAMECGSTIGFAPWQRPSTPGWTGTSWI
jgi:hypothetical protein